MLKKLLTISIILSLLMTGCWDMKELDDLVIVLGAAIDKKEDQLELTIQAPRTTPQGAGGDQKQGGSNQYLVESAIGPTLFETGRYLTESLARRNYWPHTQVVVIGEEVAKENIKTVVDFFTRDSQRRTSVFFAVTSGKGKSLLTIPSVTESTSAIGMKNLILQSSSSGFGVDIKLYKFIEETKSITRVSLLNKLELEKRPVRAVDSPEKMEVNLDGTGVFHDYKLIGYLNEVETRAAKWLRDDIKTAIISLNTEGNNKDDITLEITKSETNLTPSITDEGYLIKADVIIKGNIVEYTGKKDLLEISLDDLGKKFSKKIKDDINHVFNKAKEELKVDAFGFAEVFADDYPFLLKVDSQEWNNIFTDHVELDLNVKVKIQSSGIRLKV